MKQHGSLNHIYRLVWSEVAKAWVAVAETARGRGKGKRRTLMAVALTVTSVGSITAQAGPTGGQVTSGSGVITQSGSTTTINQSSANLALNWNTFNIAPQETVNFVQPSASAIAVNRILDPNGSQIFGHLNANGQVFLINPNGILFGEGAQVNVGGLVASTLDLNASVGDTKSFGGSGTGSVINKGMINAANGGYVALLGNHVANQGTISAQLGTVALGAGSAVTLTFDGNSLVHLQVDESVLNSLAENGGLIRADGGQVIMTAGAKDSLLASVVNNGGIIEARTVENRDGTITLLGGMAAGTVNVGGTLDASAPTGGDGGAIETSAAHVQVADSAHITTAAVAGKTGNWLVDPTDFTVASSGGDITGATLSSELASTSVTLASTSGHASGNGDIFVDDAVSWSANTTLTLNAVRNIQINNSITATGNTAGLVLTYGSGDNYYVNGAKITLSGATPSLTIAGQAYTVINSLGVQSDTTSTTLQGMLNNPSGHYALGSDINASATSGWTAIQGLIGLNPIGTSTTPFSGVFAGFNHVISNLTVNYANNSNIGLFGYTSSGALIRDVGLSGGTVNGTDYVGQLVGFNQGTISNSYATGTASDQHYLGGLVGNNTGTITSSYATGAVSSLNKIVGGLVGLNSGTISNSYATGTVTGPNKMIGGLVGENGGTIIDSYSTGKVGGATSQIGGLVGYNVGTTGTTGTVTNSFWDITTSAQTTSAGGTGMTTAQMQTLADFTSATTANGSVNPAWDFNGVWQMTDGTSYPLLRSFLTPIIVTAGNVTETYNAAIWNGSDTYTCSTGNCSLLGTATFGGTAASAINVGTYAIVPSGLYSTQQGYSITYVAGQLSITPAPLTITGLTAGNKVYNTTTADTLSGTAKVTPLGSDSITLSGTGVGTFASKNVGTGKAVTVTGYTISGAAASNYALVEPVGLTASITPASLTVSGVSASNKVYDATLTDTLTGTASVAALSGDSVTLGGTGTGTFASKNVGTGKAVTVTGYTLSGADAGNYTLVEPTGLTANVTAASLIVTGITAGNKVYDTTLTDTLSGTATVTAISGDSVSIGGTGTATFASKNVGTGKAVTVTGYTLSGADAADYTLVEPTGLTANITPASLTVTGVAASSRVYNATVTDTLTGTATVSALGSDSVALGGTGTGTFASKNVGTGKAVTVAGYTLSGADSGNYILVQPIGLTANVTPASLTVTGVSAANKVYDTTLTDTLSGTATVTAISGDSVTVGGTGSATFASKNVGTGKAVTVTGYTLSGADASNYTLVEPTGLTANVTPASLTVTGVTGTNKVYNGTLTDALSGTATITALGSDSVALGGSGTGTFASKNVGTGKAVTVTGYTISGADSGNYTLLQPTGLTANVTAASLTVTGVSASSKVYDTTLTDTLTGTATVTAISGDSVVLGGTGTATFASKNVGNGKAVAVTGYTLSGADAGNYTLVEPTGLTANITPASLTVTGVSATNKVYDTTLTDTLSGTAAVTALSGDSVTLSGSGSGTFASKNVGTGKAVTVTGYSLSGADAGNYTLVQPSGLSANVTPANLTVTGVSATSKVYDATLTDALTGTATVTALGSDSVALGGTGTATFTSKNVGTGKSVAVTGYTLSGADASNYTLIEPAGLTANITAASISVTGVSATNKIYDATVSDTLVGTATIAALGSDSLSIGGTGTGVFANKNVGTGKAVTVTGYTLSGADAGNYTLVQPTGLSANVTPASITVTGVSATNKVYDTTVADALAGTATVAALGSDSVTVGGTGTGVFASKNVGSGKAVTVTGYTLSGTDAGNYTLVQPTGLSASITPASITVTGVSATSKVYDTTLSDTLSGTAAVTALGSDSVSVSGTGTATFSSKNVGTGKAVTVTGYSLSGADASNYTIVEPTGLTANITPASITVTGVAATNKVYDTTVSDTLTGTATVTALGSDSVSVGGTGTAVFANKNVGTGKAVTVTGYTLSGADAGNYTIVEPAGLTANVTPASISVTGVIGTSKVYDSTMSDTLSGTATVNALGSDSVAVSGTGTAVFANKNVGTGKSLTVTGYSLSGTDAGNYTIVEPAGLTANITPAGITVTGVSATNKVYDTTISDTLSGTPTITALGSDSVTVTGTGSGVFANKNAGNGKAVTVSGYSLSGADAGNYTIVEPAGLTANITPASITVTGITATNKVYDTTVSDTLSGTASVTALGSDSVTLSGTGTGAFANKNVGTGKAITVTGYTLSGADAGNYTIVEPAGLTANITPASVTVTGVSATSKVYDTTVSDALSGTATVAALGSDNLSISGTGSGSFTDKNVGTGKTVTVTGYTLSGTDAGNYTLVEPAGLSANITPAQLAINGVVANNKVYDATTTASLGGIASVAALGSDSVTLGGTASAVFSNKNVGSDKSVTVTGYTLTGADAGNYTLVEPNGLLANISPANLTISGVTANNKVYDTTASASLGGTATVAALGSDSVSLAGSANAAFADKNVGTGKSVTVTGYTLTGADAGNYTLNEPTGLTANITPASIVVTGVSATNKIYDTSTVAALSGTATVAALGSDNLVLSGSGSGNFANKNVGSSKTVTVTGFTLSGADAGNYTLVEPTGLTASITPATLTVTGVSANNKVYDTTVTAALVGTPTVSALGSDSVSVGGTGSGTFADKNAGTNKAVSVTGYALTGTDAGNYVLVEPAGLSANIVAANLNITGLTASNRVYDTTTTATLGGSAAIAALGSDSVSLSGTGSGSFANKNVGTGKAVTVTGYTLSGADAGNYNLIEPSNLTASITPASITVSGVTASNKVYDTTLTDTLGGSASITALGSDNVSLSGSGSGSFANKNVGTGKAVTVTGYTLTGTDAGNYTLVEPTGLTATITPATLTVNGVSANNKVYDTTVAASLSGAPTVSALGSDSVSVGGTGSGTFADKNAGSNKPVTVTGYTLTGTDAGNYVLVEPAGLSANITPANLLVTGLTTGNKVYDGTAGATLGGTAAVSALGSDSVSLTGTGSGSFADKNVGTGKAVTVTGYGLSGTDAGNYTLVEPTSLTANITPAALTIGATAGNRVYDGLNDATATLSDNRIAGDVLTTSYASATFSDQNAANGKTVTVAGITISGIDAGNYTFNTGATTTANITQAPLTITANSFGTVYNGLTVSTGNGVSYSGLVNNETSSVLGGTLTYGGTFLGKAAAGTYTIKPSGLTSSNYAITFANGSLTIAQAPLAITASNLTESVAALAGGAFSGGNGVTYSGFVAGQSSSSLTGTLSFAGTSQGASSSGTYSLIPGGLSNPNYAITWINGTLTLTP